MPSFFFESFGYSQIHQRFADVDSSRTDINQWIAELGSPHYVVRSQAESRLMTVGGLAIPHLRAATQFRGIAEPDGEIQMRATRLLILIERREHERAIQQFLDGQSTDLEFPSWREFSNLVGSDRIARRLFVDMHQAQPDLLAATRQGKQSTEMTYQSVSKRSLRSNSDSNATQIIGTISGLLFVSTLEFNSENGLGIQQISVSDVDLRRLQSALTQTQMVTLVQSCGSEAQLKKLISVWLDSLDRDRTAEINVQLAVIQAYRLLDQLDSILGFAGNSILPPATRISALDSFYQLAEQADAERLEPLFSDQTPVGKYVARQSTSSQPGIGNPEIEITKAPPKLMQVQIRDLALATTIGLNRKNPADFGFDAGCFNGKKLNRNRAGFYSEEDRNAAFEKWASTQ